MTTSRSATPDHTPDDPPPLNSDCILEPPLTPPADFVYDIALASRIRAKYVRSVADKARKDTETKDEAMEQVGLPYPTPGDADYARAVADEAMEAVKAGDEAMRRAWVTFVAVAAVPNAVHDPYMLVDPLAPGQALCPQATLFVSLNLSRRTGEYGPPTHCTDSGLGRLAGEYSETGTNCGRPVFRKIRCSPADAGTCVFIFYWEMCAGSDCRGWRFATGEGTDFQDCNLSLLTNPADSLLPPPDGWSIPWWDTAIPTTISTYLAPSDFVIDVLDSEPDDLVAEPPDDVLNTPFNIPPAPLHHDDTDDDLGPPPPGHRRCILAGGRLRSSVHP